LLTTTDVTHLRVAGRAVLIPIRRLLALAAALLLTGCAATRAPAPPPPATTLGEVNARLVGERVVIHTTAGVRIRDARDVIVGADSVRYGWEQSDRILLRGRLPIDRVVRIEASPRSSSRNRLGGAVLGALPGLAVEFVGRQDNSCVSISDPCDSRGVPILTTLAIFGGGAAGYILGGRTHESEASAQVFYEAPLSRYGR
jgi:hypothetical protein